MEANSAAFSLAVELWLLWMRPWAAPVVARGRVLRGVWWRLCFVLVGEGGEGFVCFWLAFWVWWWWWYEYGEKARLLRLLCFLFFFANVT